MKKILFCVIILICAFGVLNADTVKKFSSFNIFDDSQFIGNEATQYSGAYSLRGITSFNVGGYVTPSQNDTTFFYVVAYEWYDMDADQFTVLDTILTVSATDTTGIGANVSSSTYSKFGKVKFGLLSNGTVRDTSDVELHIHAIHDK